jgi:hypothetical protein
MSDLREQVARAICVANGNRPDDELGGVGGQAFWQLYVPDADVAIRVVLDACAKDGFTGLDYCERAIVLNAIRIGEPSP